MIYRKMEWTDIPSGLSLCRSAGWNQLSRDWEIFLSLDPEGNRVCINDDGNVIGTVTTIRYGDRFAWIGMVLVDPLQRRRGIGLGLLEQAQQVLKNERCLKLDATPDGRQVYTRLGFEDEYGLSRLCATTINKNQLASSMASALTAADRESVRSFDLGIFGADRMQLLSWMLDGANEFAFKVVDGNQLRGYCFGRSGFKYAHIGPVVASDDDVAKSLISAALAHCNGRPVILDVPHHHHSWRRWLESLGFSELRSFLRMFKGSNLFPGIPQNQYAILGPEFG